MSWCVKAVYPHGSHYVFNRDGQTLRFKTQQEAKVAAEDIAAENRRFTESKGWNPNPNVSYLAVEEHL
jgi:ribosomal protein L24E